MFLLKKATRYRESVMRYFSLESYFRLLDHLANQRNSNASLIYKKLAFSLIENYNEPELK